MSYQFIVVPPVVNACVAVPPAVVPEVAADLPAGAATQNDGDRRDGREV